MSLSPYRQVLAVPGVRALLLVGILARVPSTAIGVTLLFHVTNTLGRSWAQAGLVTAAYTVGAALGQPLTGRLLDRKGMRIAMIVTAGVEAVVWAVAPHLSYAVLLGAAVIGGLFALPVFSAVRLSLAAMVPEHSRRPAFALDSMIVELSFMVGPAVAVVLATSLPSGAGLYCLAAGLVASAALLCWLNPPTQPEGHEVPEVAPPRRSWFSARLVALMITGAAAVFVLAATEITIVASMKEAGVAQWTGLVIALWCAYSLAGGLVFGALRSRVSALTLVAAMALLTIPIGLASGWPWLVLALLPSGVLCAPTMTAANDNVAAIVPVSARGEAIGMLGSAFTVGVALGAPFAGAVIDAVGPQWAFAAAGTGGAVAILAAFPLYRRVLAHAPQTADEQTVDEPTPVPAHVGG